MYLSEVHLQNWRSYRDATFRFKPPTKRRPLVLIGAMNGHGKTSFLLSLYLGLFGRFGLRHAEGFASHLAENLGFYRDAVTKFRRNSAPPDEPTVIDLTFAPTSDEAESGETEARIVRRWFFAGNGRPRQGDNFEEVELHIDGKPRRLADADAAVDRLERTLFPASFMPAFVFDGEQAQTLINNSGTSGIKKSVEVLFGTKILEDVGARVKQYITQSRSRIGGTRTVTAQQRALDEKLSEREKLEKAIDDLQAQLGATEQRRSQLEQQQQSLNERLARLGGASRDKITELQAQLAKVNEQVRNAEDELTNEALALGSALAVSRLAPAIVNRLTAEQIREQWEGLQQGTLARADEVLQVAMPEPPESDELLGHLAPGIRQKVKERFRRALAEIYQPPPDGCATEYRLGHVGGEMRQRLLAHLERVRNTRSSSIQETARRLKAAREQKQDLDARRAHFEDLPAEVQQIYEELKDVGAQIAEASRLLGSLERERTSKRAALDALNAAIGQLQEQLAAMGPDQKRIAIAERIHRAIDSLGDQLRPMALRRMEELITSHFSAIADRRFRSGRIEFAADSAPVMKLNSQADYLLETMSGFERRSFGIAFSLALAELTRRRIPLVIDTPLGNADTEYRPRLLEALTNVELDQIIILTHDAEVTGELFEKIRPQLQQTFLVQYDPSLRESLVKDGEFFRGIGV